MTDKPKPACVVCQSTKVVVAHPDRCGDHRLFRFERRCLKCGEIFWTSNRPTIQHKVCPNRKDDAPVPPDKVLQSDREQSKSHAEITLLRSKYKEAITRIESLEAERDSAEGLRGTIDTFRIEPQKPSRDSEATAVWAASDWHVEENVDPATVNGLNSYSLDIATKRATRFFRSGLRLTDILNKDIQINTIVLALLGDFFTNQIHEEFADLNETTPVHAAIAAQNMIASGIEFILKNSKYSLVIPCHSGNHARMSQTTRYGSENGHSLEFYMYGYLAAYFRNQPRVKFLIAPAYHQYVDIYGMSVRFHHGHALRYQGGVGGLYIPTHKAIAQWNKARRADLDIFGHFHTFRDGGNFICNGSMIGYNAWGLAMKFDFEPPKQALCLIDKKRGRTCVWPILFDEEDDAKEKAA